MGLKGFVVGEGVLLKPDRLKTESFAAQVEEWRGVLTKLAEQFAAGEAGGGPQRYSEKGAHCRAGLLFPVGAGKRLGSADEGGMGGLSVGGWGGDVFFFR